MFFLAEKVVWNAGGSCKAHTPGLKIRFLKTKFDFPQKKVVD